jgi:hypothetical protein
VERGVRDPAGGILSLAALVEEHSGAVKADLLRAGYRLRWLDDPSRDFNWDDVYVLVSTAEHGSATYRAVHGDEETEWTLANHLLAMVVENTSLNLWMKTKDATRSNPRDRPKPIPRPGVVDDSKKVIGGDVLEFHAMIEFLGDGYEVLLN